MRKEDFPEKITVKIRNPDSDFPDYFIKEAAANKALCKAFAQGSETITFSYTPERDDIQMTYRKQSDHTHTTITEMPVNKMFSYVIERTITYKKSADDITNKL